MGVSWDDSACVQEQDSAENILFELVNAQARYIRSLEHHVESMDAYVSTFADAVACALPVDPSPSQLWLKEHLTFLKNLLDGLNDSRSQ